MNYQINFFDQLKNLVFIKVLESKPKMFAYLKALLAPIQTTNDSFLSLIQWSRREAVFNGQVMYLEKALNLEFDPVLSRIFIEDGAFNTSPPYLYRIAEERPLYLYKKSENNPLYLYKKSEYNNPIHFIVRIPSNLLPLSTQIAQLVDSLKQAGKTYQILTI